MEIFVAENSQKKVLVPDCKPAPTPESGYNFKALSCEAAHLSPQFPCLSIENFLLLTYRLNI